MKTTVHVALATLRFWRDEAPDAAYVGGDVVRRRVPPVQPSVATTSTLVGVEVWWPQGARALYGLLGVELTAGGEACDVRVPICTGADGPRYADTLAAAYDDVRVGLPEEYGAAVADSLARGARALGLRGTLSVNRCAHSFVGTSNSALAALATLAVRLLVERLEEQQPERIGLMFRDASSV